MSNKQNDHDPFWCVNKQNWRILVTEYLRKYFFLHCTLPYIDVCSVASFLVMRKERKIERKKDNQYMSMSICRYRERSNQTKQTQIMYCVAVRIDVSSVTLCVFSSLTLATSVRLLYCCYDDNAIYMYSLSFFFFVSVIVAVVV